MDITEMLACQRELWEIHKDEWSPLEPKYARNSLLWMMGEIGEVIEIIKKSGDERIVSDNAVKAAFTEEMVDVLMYWCDTLLRYGITGEEIASAYRKKHEKNMRRSYKTEDKAFTDNLK